MKYSITPLVAAALCAATATLASPAVLAASLFTISGSQTLPQTLTNNDTLTIDSTGSLSISAPATDPAVTVSGSVTINNHGAISNSDGARAIKGSKSTNVSLTLNNDGTINGLQADMLKLYNPGDSITVTNNGTLSSGKAKTASNLGISGGQALDLNDITTGSNVVDNGLENSDATIEAYGSDAVRPGANGIIHNAGTIQSTNDSSDNSGNDGIDAKDNSGVTITNDAGGTIEGARHGITGGNTDRTTAGNYAMTVTNNTGGTIQGDDGSGINIDGFNNNELVTVVNHGTISANVPSTSSSTLDSDGIDVDGLIDLNNTGTIKSLNSGPQEVSEGVTVGGGTIVNSGTIIGTNSLGTMSHGITLAGLDKDANGNPIPTQGIMADSSVTNSGLIKGGTGSGIAVTGATNDKAVTIMNRPTGIIEGGGSEAAVFTGGNSATVNNRGTIKADGSGDAVDLGSGNSKLLIEGGQASIQGNISGGSSGKSQLHITPGSGNQFAYADNAADFAQMDVGAGTTVLNGNNTNIGTTKVNAGKLIVGDQSHTGASLASQIFVGSGAALAGDGTVGTTTTNTTIAQGGLLTPGTGNGNVGTLNVQGPLTLNGMLAMDLLDLGNAFPLYDQVNVNGAVNFGTDSLLGLNLLGGVDLKQGDTFALMTAASFTGLSNLSLQPLDYGQGWQFGFGLAAPVVNVASVSGPTTLQLTVQKVGHPVPAPGSLGLLGLGLLLIGGFQWRIRRQPGSTI